MKKTLILLAFCSLPAMAFSQNGGAAAQATVASDGQVHDKVEQPPRFPGGYEALERWKEQHIVYPEEAIERGAQGQVVVRFVILNTGEVADAEILRSIDPALDKEALRLVSSMPKWTPGMQDGNAVSVRWDEPVTFTLPTAEEIAEMERKKKEKEQQVFDMVEQMPKFPGGQSALMQWLSTNMKYPKIAAENGIEGRVYVLFIVRSTGEITDIKIARSVDPSLDEEAIRTISRMPKWIPGKQGGEAVNVRYTMPLTFRL